MNHPDRVMADLSKLYKEQDEFDRNYDPADLSEVTEEEVNEAWDHAPASVRSDLMQDIRSEDWELFALRYRQMLIEYRKL